MKNSTRIALAITVVWLGLVVVAVVDRASDTFFVTLIVVLPVIWALKFILGAYVDSKAEQ